MEKHIFIIIMQKFPIKVVTKGKRILTISISAIGAKVFFSSLFHKLECIPWRPSSIVPFNRSVSLIFYYKYSFAINNILFFGFVNNFPRTILFQCIRLHFHGISPFLLCQSFSNSVRNKKIQTNDELLWLADNLSRET